MCSCRKHFDKFNGYFDVNMNFTDETLKEKGFIESVGKGECICA